MTHFIRPCGPADAEALAAAHVQWWHHYYGSLLPRPALDEMAQYVTAERWRSRLCRPAAEDRTWAVWTGHELTGFATAGPAAPGTGPPASGEIFCFYTSPAVNSPLLPWNLMRHCVTFLDSRQFLPVRLWVLAVNSHARRYFELCGFVADSAERPQQFDGTEFQLMRYRLNPQAAARGTRQPGPLREIPR
jgi:ribosomal protein S18 acetylase RimI-like enzyme